MSLFNDIITLLWCLVYIRQKHWLSDNVYHAPVKGTL